MRPLQAFWLYVIAILCITSLLIFSGYSITSDNSSMISKGRCATYVIILALFIPLDIILIVKFFSGDFLEDCTVEERRTISPVIPTPSSPFIYLNNETNGPYVRTESIDNRNIKINNRFGIMEIE